MSYKKLYQFAQTLEPKVKRNILLDKAIELTGEKPVSTIKTGLDPEKIRGYFVSADNAESRFVKLAKGKNVIVLAREQTYCWQRFVFIKELMHLFDSPEEKTANAEHLEKVLTELYVPSGIQCLQTTSEFRCFWMALALTCPESYRLDFENKKKQGSIDNYAIATLLKIPLQNVPFLFQPRFKNFVDSLQ